MRFRRVVSGATVVWRQPLAPRSAYVLDGAARWTWQHHVPPVSETRTSITFRTVRASPRQPGES